MAFKDDFQSKGKYCCVIKYCKKIKFVKYLETL